jgi:hypothetical protein
VDRLHPDPRLSSGSHGVWSGAGGIFPRRFDSDVKLEQQDVAVLDQYSLPSWRSLPASRAPPRRRARRNRRRRWSRRG